MIIMILSSIIHTSNKMYTEIKTYQQQKHEHHATPTAVTDKLTVWLIKYLLIYLLNIDNPLINFLIASILVWSTW